MKVDIPEKREKKEKTKPNRYIYIQNHDPEGWIGFWVAEDGQLMAEKIKDW